MKCLRMTRNIALFALLMGRSASFLNCQGVATGSSTQPLSSVPASRLARLRHGINASAWFAQVYDKRGYTKEHFQTWTTAEDIALIKSLGFDHVRLSVNPLAMMTSHRPDEIPAEYLGHLDAAVGMILDQQLSVVIDLDPESDFKSRLATDNSFVQEFSDFWRALARHYSTWDADRVFLEILNEPEFNDRYRWYGVQAKLAAAIRDGAPQHTIIAAGARWSDDDELVFLEPLRDPNVIYTFHFYEPHIFTHQGATWGTYFWHWVKGLRYPSSPENAFKVAGSVPDAVDRLAVIRYDKIIGTLRAWMRILTKSRNGPGSAESLWCAMSLAFIANMRSRATARPGFTTCAHHLRIMPWGGRCGIILAASEWSRKRMGEVFPMKLLCGRWD